MGLSIKYAFNFIETQNVIQPGGGWAFYTVAYNMNEF